MSNELLIAALSVAGRISRSRANVVFPSRPPLVVVNCVATILSFLVKALVPLRKRDCNLTSSFASFNLTPNRATLIISALHVTIDVNFQFFCQVFPKRIVSFKFRDTGSFFATNSRISDDKWAAPSVRRVIRQDSVLPRIKPRIISFPREREEG